MKTRIILLFLVCFSGIISAQNNDILITSWDKISLNGNWKGKGEDGDKDTRSIPYIPVIASLEKDILTLEFMEVGSDVTVTIVGKNQILLSHSLWGDIPEKYCIPIDTYTPGVYLLELSNSQGGYIYGWFELK